MESKKVRPHRIWKEEIEDYTIDLKTLKYKKKRKLIEDGTVTKLFMREGKGSEAKFGATVYYTLEARFKDGTLCNPRADRKGTNKIVLKNESEDTRVFEIALANSKFGETFWCRITGKLLQSLKFYKELPSETIPEGADLTELWCKFFIIRIKHPYKKIFCDFNTLVVCVEEAKSIAKEYVELAHLDSDLYDYALEVYKNLITMVKELTKQIRSMMSDGDFAKRALLLGGLYLNVALIQLKKEEYALAKEAAESALHFDPDNIKAHYRLAQACIKNKDLQAKTFAALKVCFEKEPGNPALKEYAEWYTEYQKKKDERKAKRDQWKKYSQILEAEELEEKQKRRKERLGEENVKEVDDRDDIEEVYDLLDDEKFYSQDSQAVANEWNEVLKQEEEEKRAKNKN